MGRNYLDVSALFISIDNRIAGRLTKEEITSSQMKFQGIDWRWDLV